MIFKKRNNYQKKKCKKIKKLPYLKTTKLEKNRIILWTKRSIWTFCKIIQKFNNI